MMLGLTFPLTYITVVPSVIATLMDRTGHYIEYTITTHLDNYLKYVAEIRYDYAGNRVQVDGRLLQIVPAGEGPRQRKPRRHLCHRSCDQMETLPESLRRGRADGGSRRSRLMERWQDDTAMLHTPTRLISRSDVIWSRAGALLVHGQSNNRPSRCNRTGQETMRSRTAAADGVD
ncbi:hypothetical protein J6590_020332 [Homalodisca vitripennis]|nr:hypothetical protein J6590_020332 [Homalodisca vitripennis]